MVIIMVVGLPPLDFKECMSDSPYFRENLHKHEKELDNTSQQIKRIIKEVKDLLNAARRKLILLLLGLLLLLWRGKFVVYVTRVTQIRVRITDFCLWYVCFGNGCRFVVVVVITWETNGIHP